LKKFLRYALKGLAVFIGVLILVYIIAYIYIVSNKAAIITQIKDQVADKLNGEVQIGNISLGFLAQFPNVSVELDKVSIRDTLFNQHKHPFFQAEKVYGSVSVVNLLQKNNPLNGLRIDNGQLYIFTDSSGYTNSYLLKPKTGAEKVKRSSAKTEIEAARLQNVRLVLDDRQKRKLFDFDVVKVACSINNNADSTITFKTRNKVFIHDIAFDTRQGGFAHEAQFEGSFALKYDKNRKQLSFDNIGFRVKDQPFNVSGVFNFTEAPTFALTISTDKIDYALAKSLVTRKIDTALSMAKVEKPVSDVKADISGPLKGGDPLVKIVWKLENSKVESVFADLTNCSLTGSFTNELVAGLPRKDPNSRIQFRNFKGDWEGLKVSSNNIYIDNLKTPTITADIKSEFDLTQLNNLLQSNTIDLHKGNGTVNLTYSGPMEKNNNSNTILNGKIAFSNGTLMYHPRNIPMTNVNGNIVFKNTDVYVTDFRGNVQGNKIVMNGSGKNLLALLRTNPGKIFLDWNIYSPSLNLGNFTSLLRKRVNTVKRGTGRSKLARVSQNLDEVVNQANFRLDVKADNLTYKRFNASNVKASLELVNENWKLNTVSLQHAGGSMAINGDLTAKNNRYYQSNVKVNMENVDVNKVMYAFNDFGQDGISHDNLRGKLTATAAVRMDLDRDLQSQPENIEGYVDFSLKKGGLLHYSPLEKIQKVVFKKRNFDEVYFAELKDRLDIKNKEVTIHRMEIESTVITLYVEGVYSLRGNTDISIQVPLSNIKKRDEDYVPANKGVDAKAGASLYVRGRPGDDGNIQFKLDLFKKFRKNDRASTDSSREKSMR
jgi:hypothetical protein